MNLNRVFFCRRLARILGCVILCTFFGVYQYKYSKNNVCVCARVNKNIGNHFCYIQLTAHMVIKEMRRERESESRRK